jgi:hypothetical protein
MTNSQHVYEVRSRKDKRGFDLLSDVLPFGRLWYAGPNAVANAIGYAKHYSRSNDAVIRIYNAAGNVIETTSTKAISRSGEALQIKQKAAMLKRGGSFASCCCL